MSAATSRRRISFGPFEFDAMANLLYRGRREVVLPLRAAGVLRALLDRPGEVLSKDELLGEVWKDAFVGEDSLTHAISMVRQALGDDPHDPTYVQTVPKRGYRFIGEIGTASELMLPETSRRPFRLTLLAIGFIIVLVVGLALRGWLREAPGAAHTAEFLVILPEGLAFDEQAPLSTMDVSPDGRTVVFTAQQRDSRRLYLRRLDSLEVEPLPGTEGAFISFFSPDGRSIAFGNDRLRRLDLAGGQPVDLCHVGMVAGGSWGRDGSIVFNPAWNAGLLVVPDTGGEPRPLTELVEDEFGHWYPQILPDGKHVLFTVWRTGLADVGVSVASLDTGETNELLRGGSFARYLPSGHLVYAQAGRLMATRFDLGSLAVVGHAVPILEGVDVDPLGGIVHVVVSESGTLVYRLGGDWFSRRRLVWVDRIGRSVPLDLAADGFLSVALSPDGERLALTVFEEGQANIHVHDLTTGRTEQITFGPFDMLPIWRSDGKQIAFTTSRDGPFAVYTVPATLGGVGRPVVVDQSDRKGSDWAPDGSVILAGLNQDWDFFVPGSDEAPVPFAPMPGNLSDLSFSPDGQWIAFQSDAGGRGEVYVASHPGAESVVKISSAGGDRPLWSPSGDELFYVEDETVIAVGVRVEDGRFIAGDPQPLFEKKSYVWGEGHSWAYDADTDRFIMIEPGDNELWTDRFVVETNWLDELRRLLPERQ